MIGLVAKVGDANFFTNNPGYGGEPYASCFDGSYSMTVFLLPIKWKRRGFYIKIKHQNLHCNYS